MAKEPSAVPPGTGSHVEWYFGAFRLAPSRGLLLRGGSEVPLARKSFEILVHLVRHRERVVPRDEILEAIWSGASVSESAVASAIRDLRRCLGDPAGQSRFVATVRGRGFHFVHPVREVASSSSSSSNPSNSNNPGANAWDTAAIHFERALDALDLVETSRGQVPGRSGTRVPRERGELIVALARARWSGGATDAARDAFREAADVARHSGDAEILSQAALGFVGRSDVTPGVNQDAVALLEESLSLLSERDSALRAELLARLGTELYYDTDPSRSERLTTDALAMAERVGEPSVTAYACTARHFTSQRPEVPPEDRLALTDRAISLANHTPGSDVLVFALQERLIDLFELGRGDAFEETFDRFEHAVEMLGQPFFEWLLSMYRGTRALLAGGIDEAEQLAHETLALGKRVGTPNAEGVLAGQIFAVRREQGRLGELAPALDAVARSQRALPIFRAGRAAVAATHSRRDAEDAVEEVMTHDLDDFPRDQNWIATLGTLAPAVVAARNERRVRQLAKLMNPYAGRMIVVGQGAATHGAVSHHLGTLHAVLGENELATRHFEQAAALHHRARAPLWIEHTARARDALAASK